ncbi:hypothetical protein FRC08_000791 [Ceratobasidium sp. 394]|nr:hypothetical protein FRC08_000791 [Ceratobasidium sp. 394]
MSLPVAPSKIPRLRLAVPNMSIEHEDMCHFCGDGGILLQCTYCPAAYCYAISDGSKRRPTDQQICIELPQNTNLQQFVFECPVCYSVSKSTSAPPYLILRPVRRVRRVTAGHGQPALVLAIFYLPVKTDAARVLSERVAAAIEALEIQVAVILQPIDDINVSYIDKLVESVGPLFKIWCMIYTESDPRGGWWIDSGSSAGRATPDEVLPHLLDSALKGWAEKSKGAYVVVISCGMNLQILEERRQLIKCFSGTKWDALIAPSAPAVFSPDFVSMLPNLVAQTQFIQFELEPALLRCWLKTPRVRDHTDLYVLTRKSREEAVKASVWIHAPTWRRPWGIELPALLCVCSCAAVSGKSSGWVKRYGRTATEFGEVYLFFSTSCCRHELHLAIYTGTLKLLDRHGTNVVFAPLDDNGRREFNYAEMCTIKRCVRTLPASARDVH